MKFAENRGVLSEATLRAGIHPAPGNAGGGRNDQRRLVAAVLVEGLAATDLATIRDLLGTAAAALAAGQVRGHDEIIAELPASVASADDALPPA